MHCRLPSYALTVCLALALGAHADDLVKPLEVQKVFEPQYILWKPCMHDGVFYAAAHKKDESSAGKGREVHFVKSADGIKWVKVSTIRAGNWESETTLFFDEKHHATAFLRQKYGA